MNPPANPSVFHIVHHDRLASIVSTGGLLSDAQVVAQRAPGTTIGMSRIKQRRLGLPLATHQGLRVGECVPFYFCPRSIMLYLIHKANHVDLAYRGGQQPIVHLEADLRQAVAWAEQNSRRWAFTLSNAGSNYFEDRADLASLGEVDWAAVAAHNWSRCIEAKQAEFLVEQSFPWELVSRIGVQSQRAYNAVLAALGGAQHQPTVEILPDWYY